jgi:hypothetical protein
MYVPGFAGAGTAVRYGLPVSSHVTLRLYSMQGKLVRILCSGRQAAGYHRIPLASAALARGYYIMYFNAGNYTARKRVCVF